MTRFIHDQFAKQYLKELLEPFGEVETSRDIVGEVRQIDIIFVPKPQNDTQRKTLGRLGQLAQNHSVFEPFRNAIQSSDIRRCMSKVFDFHAALERKASRDKKKITEAELPQLCILSPTVSEQIIEGFGAKNANNWGKGIYFLHPELKTAIVVIHKLERTPDTLWLRVLGKGKVQSSAMSELRSLPEDNPFRANTLELVYSLFAILDARQDLDSEDKELIMELSPIYLEQLENATNKGVQQGLQQGLQQGIGQGLQQGLQQGKRLMVENMLKVKFGAIDEELGQIVDPLIQIEALESTQMIMQLSREELLARFQQI